MKNWLEATEYLGTLLGANVADAPSFHECGESDWSFAEHVCHELGHLYAQDLPIHSSSTNKINETRYGELMAWAITLGVLSLLGIPATKDFIECGLADQLLTIYDLESFEDDPTVLRGIKACHSVFETAAERAKAGTPYAELFSWPIG